MPLQLSNAQSYQAYVQKFGEELISKMFFGKQTPQLVKGHEGVKGKLTLTELLLGTLVQRWRKQFDDNDVDFQPVTIETTPAKADVTICPAELESSYLGEMRRLGQNPRDFPFQAYVFQKIVEKVAQEIETAYWQAVKKTPEAATDTLIQLFDGFLEQLQQEVNDNNLTPYNQGTENIVEAIEGMFGQLAPAYQGMPIGVFMSYAKFQEYQTIHRENYSKYTNSDQTGTLTLDIANNVTLHALAGMGTSDKVIVSPYDNFNIAYDLPSDEQRINTEWDKRELCAWIDFKIGCKIIWTDDASKMIQVLNFTDETP